MKNLSKRIMILGAGPLQVRAIRKAVELGYEVVTVDYLPGNVGHSYSHHSVSCSTTDREGVLHAAREMRIDGICTFSSDVAIPTVGYVCEELGLPGFSVRVATIMANKHLFRAFLRENGLEYPRFVAGRSFDEVRKELEKLQFPIMFKPVDSSGSRGITKLKTRDMNKAITAFELSKSFSRSGTVCVEEFVYGIEVSGDGILMEGRFAFIAITHKHLNGVVVTGHSLPANISKADQWRVISALEECCRAIDYTEGPLNFDVKVAPNRVTILEMSPRNGGNGIPSVIKRAMGIDVETAALRLALGEPVSLGCEASIRGCGSFVFGSELPGILQGIASLETLQKAIPEVFDIHTSVNRGEKVGRFDHNGNMIGYVLFDCKGPEEYESLAACIQQELCVNVEAVR